MKTEKRVFLYVRVSTQEQAKEGYSIDEQIERLKKYADAHGWIIVKIYTDAGYSGGSTERPALQDMIRDVRAGLGDMVVVYKLDRLSRSQKDTLELIEDVFLINNVDFVSMNEKFDTSTPFGRAMIGILAVFAQLEREQIKERMVMGREGRAKEGKFHGGGTEPVGYDYVDGELVVNEFEAMQIKELFELYLSGISARSIEKIFIEKGYTHKHGTWKAYAVRKILTNDLYIGNVTFGGKSFPGNHTAIIDVESFEKAKKIAEDRATAYHSLHRVTKSSTLLGGMLKCGHCGGKYGVTTSGWSKGRKGYRFYCCYSRRKQNRAMIVDPNCKNKNWRLEDLDNIVLDQIRKLSIDPDYILKMKEEKQSGENCNKTEILKKELKKIDSQRSRLMDLYGIGEYTIEEVQKKVKPLNEQKEKIEKEIERLTFDASKLTVAEAKHLISSFDEIIERGENHEIRLLIESLIDLVEIDNETVTIHWKFV